MPSSPTNAVFLDNSRTFKLKARFNPFIIIVATILINRYTNPLSMKPPRHPWSFTSLQGPLLRKFAIAKEAENKEDVNVAQKSFVLQPSPTIKPYSLTARIKRIWIWGMLSRSASETKIVFVSKTVQRLMPKICNWTTQYAEQYLNKKSK
jgi:hypothetical protein